MRDMGDLLGRPEVGENSGVGGKLGEGRGHGG
jgi:hypothetical protein